MTQLRKKLTMALGFSLISFASFSTQTIYGLQKASQFRSNSSGKLYVQVGSFKNKGNALRLRTALKNKTRNPVLVKEKNGYFIVVVGPMHTAAAVRSAAHDIGSTSTSTYIAHKKPKINRGIIHSQPPVMHATQTSKPVQKAPPIAVYKDKDGFLLAPSNRWFVGLGAGWMSPFGTDSVNFASSGMPGFPDDRYSSEGSESAGQYSVLAGYQWRRDVEWLPAYSLALQYTYTDSASINGFIFVNDLPDSKNFTYKYDISQHLLMAKAKLDLYRWKQLMPYVSAGAGVAINNAHSYSDRPIPGATLMQRRYGFTSGSQSQFAGSFGAGLDYGFNDRAQLSLGYELSYYGNANTGNGLGVLSANNLENTFNSNAVVLQGIYFFDR